MTQPTTFRERFAKVIAGPTWPTDLSSITSRVDDSPGWSSLSNRPHDYDASKVQELYADALEAWRKNFMVRRITGLIRSYVVGGGIVIAAVGAAAECELWSRWGECVQPADPESDKARTG